MSLTPTLEGKDVSEPTEGHQGWTWEIMMVQNPRPDVEADRVVLFLDKPTRKQGSHSDAIKLCKVCG